jgi:hypothetical protein
MGTPLFTNMNITAGWVGITQPLFSFYNFPARVTNSSFSDKSIVTAMSEGRMEEARQWESKVFEQVCVAGQREAVRVLRATG